jgi:predicted phosphodiesterase
MATQDQIKTRILIISDTHGVGTVPKKEGGTAIEDEFNQEDIQRVPSGYRDPLPEVDVVLHCGDLTKRSMDWEYENTLAMLRAIRAPLKLFIAGNHDLALHKEFWEENCDYIHAHRNDGVDHRAAALKAIEEAVEDGVTYLTEGTYTFDLQNGARLKIYASQWTPEYGGWAFQYRDGHNFEIPADVDIAMTHGPPKGVLDLAGIDKVKAGCDDLFGAVYRSRPKIHCFGHIHEAWGAYLAKWKDEGDEHLVRAASVIDESGSHFIKRLKGLWMFKVFDGATNKQQTREELAEMSQQRGCHIDIAEGENKLHDGAQTLFVNAAIMNLRYLPMQCPWIVDVNLPATSRE